MAERADVLGEWASHAAILSWDRSWDAVFQGEGSRGTWFAGGTLNIAGNCVDRHIPRFKNAVAFYWEGEPGDRRTVTYGDLHEEVTAFAGALIQMGVRPGDRVALHMGVVPEWAVAMLACARIGAVSSVLAISLPPDALVDRIADLQPRVLVTQDGAWRHGVILPLKARADESLAAGPGVENTIVVRRTGVDVAWYEGDCWYEEVIHSSPGHSELEAFDTNHPLLIVYVANHRGRPTGIVLGSGGFLTCATALHRIGFSSRRSDEVLWCAVDSSWVAAVSHAVFGALSSRATSILYEGMLDSPTHARAWQIIQRYRATSLLTSPSVARRLRSWEDALPQSFDLSSLRCMLTGGEPLDQETRKWLYEDVGSKNVVVGNGWGQTELGGMVSIDHTCGGEELPDPGLDVVDQKGVSVGSSRTGELVLHHPWPGSFLGINGGDDGTALSPYWDKYPGIYATRDWARRERDGSLVLLGRMDRHVSISGQLVSLSEVGEVLIEHPFVQDVEIVEQVGRGGGEGLAACVTLIDEVSPSRDLARGLRTHVQEILGGLARPQSIAFVEEFPAEIAPEERRSALRTLCATSTDGPLEITAAQVRAAVAAQGNQEVESS
jgi:acetyl-CoA synthetase